MDDQQKPTEALDASDSPARRLRPWMVAAGSTFAALVIVGIVVAVALPRPPVSPTSVSQPQSGSPEAPSSPSASPASPRPQPSDTATAELPANDEQSVAAPAAPAPAAPAPAAPPAPAEPGPPALPPPPAPIITPTITTFTASNYNNSTQTIAQGCASSASGELAIRIVWATENTTPTIKFRTQISGSPPIDETITGYGASGQNHYLQLRCSKIAYVTMTLHSDNQERQARLTIDGNGPAGWSYLN